MIDFYKHSILSILGKEAGALTETEYCNKIVTKCDEYIELLKEKKKEIDENGGNNNTEIYL